jgi:hypothetical protein
MFMDELHGNFFSEKLPFSRGVFARWRISTQKARIIFPELNPVSRDSRFPGRDAPPGEHFRENGSFPKKNSYEAHP